MHSSIHCHQRRTNAINGTVRYMMYYWRIKKQFIFELRRDNSQVVINPTNSAFILVPVSEILIIPVFSQLRS